MMQDVGCEPKMILEFNSVAAIISNVKAGLGVTLIPEVTVRSDVNINNKSINDAELQ